MPTWPQMPRRWEGARYRSSRRVGLPWRRQGNVPASTDEGGPTGVRRPEWQRRGTDWNEAPAPLPRLDGQREPEQAEQSAETQEAHQGHQMECAVPPGKARDGHGMRGAGGLFLVVASGGGHVLVLEIDLRAGRHGRPPE